MRKALKMSLLLGTIAVLLALTACGVDGDYKTNNAPIISITSWEGADNVAAADSLESLVFQQRIYWNTNDNDGTVAGIAYRILDANGNPIATPGNSVVDNLGEIESINYDGEQLVGWVVHYKEGADENIPLTSDLAKKTIWSQQKYAIVNFPANENGEPSEQISSFEVICIDNMGSVSNIARKSFKAISSVPTFILSTSRGNPAGKQVGTGLYITFSMSTAVGDPLAVSGADYYEYKVGKYVYDAEADTTSNAVLIEETDWFVTDSQEITLTKNTSPSLTPDFDGIETDATQLTFTRVTGHAFNYAGVQSDESIIEFAVKEGFHPQTVIYPEKVYAIGDYHYKDYVVTEDPENYPHIYKDGPIPIIYATSFFTDNQGRLSAVNSTNLKVYAKWGYYGQYGTPPTSSTGAIVFSDSPYDTEVGRVLNEADNKDYYSEIVAYDIRFDDAPYDFYALSQDPNNTVTHEDGTQWLRVPKSSVWSISKGLEMNNLDSGLHTLEIAAVDLQYEYDPTPAILNFYLEDFLPKEERNQVLVLDTSSFLNWTSTQAFADSVYQSVLGDFPGVEFYKRSELNAITGLSLNACNIAYSDLVKYKTIVYREEHNSSTYFHSDYDALKLYLDNGGSLIFSAEENLRQINQKMMAKSQTMFMKYFGINFVATSINNLPANSPFVKGATPTGDIPSIQGLPDLDLYLGHSHNPLIANNRGFSDLSYFPEDYAAPEDYTTKVIYRAKVKTVGEDTHSPATEEVFNQFNQVPVAVGKVTTQNRCFVFGFPLSHIEKPELTQLFDNLLNY